MKTKLLFTLFFIGQLMNAQLYINEILISPPGNDSPNEYIELRGVPNATIPAGTYLVGIDGDGDDTSSPGDVESDIINLSGLQIGSNGYLVLLTTGHPYTVDSNATIALDLTDGDLEDQTHTYLLIQTNTPPTTADDIDSDNDGTPDGAVYANWTVLDGIAFADADGTLPHDEFAYANVIFAMEAIVTTGTLKYPAGATVILTATQFDYAARIGVSTGSSVTNDETTSDWVAGDIPSGNVPNWVLTGTTANVIPSSFAASQLNHIGSINPSVNTLSIPSNELASKINFYPNPAKNTLNFTSNDLAMDSILFYTVEGKEVLNIKNFTNNTLDISSLSKGIYSVRVNTQEGVLNKKIIVK